MGFGASEVVHRRQHRPDDLGNHRIPIRSAIALDPDTEVHELGLRTKHVITHVGDEVALGVVQNRLVVVRERLGARRCPGGVGRSLARRRVTHITGLWIDAALVALLG